MLLKLVQTITWGFCQNANYDSVTLKWDLKFCSAIKLPGDTNTADEGSYF